MKNMDRQTNKGITITPPHTHTKFQFKGISVFSHCNILLQAIVVSQHILLNIRAKQLLTSFPEVRYLFMYYESCIGKMIVLVFDVTFSVFALYLLVHFYYRLVPCFFHLLLQTSFSHHYYKSSACHHVHCLQVLKWVGNY